MQVLEKLFLLLLIFSTVFIVQCGNVATQQENSTENTNTAELEAVSNEVTAQVDSLTLKLDEAEKEIEQLLEGVE